MKRCASCTKELPDAALHCVFCGAKQAAAPAVQPGLAKTAFGYSANEMMEQLKAQAPVAAPYSQSTRPGPSQPPPVAQPSYGPPAAGGPPGYGPPGYGQPQTGLAAASVANAPTMFVQGGPPQAQAYHAGTLPVPAHPMSGGMPPPASGVPGMGGGMGIHSPPQPTPAPLPAVGSPYLSSQTAARAGWPIEPWKDSLRLIMFVWGALTLAAFATPLAIDPLTFHWDAILHAEGTAKLPPLIFAAVGLLAVVIAAIPLAPLPRGILAALLGLAGILVPILLIGMPPWELLLELVGMVLLVSGLLVRNEYCESLFARILVTIGVICTLLPVLLPVHGDIPLVGMFKALIDAPGVAKVAPALRLGAVVIVVMTLLAWMPGPATGGAKVFAWLVILWPTLVTQIAMLIVGGHAVEAVKASPYGAAAAWIPEAAYLVLVGYGLATAVGKQLE